MKHIIIIFILLPFFLKGQTSNGILVKSLLLQDAFYQNPNLVIEKLISDHYSAELLLALRNGDWYMPGGEGPPLPKFATSTGFTIGLSTRYYLSKESQIPNSFFTSLMARYNNTKIKNAEIQTGIDSEPRMVNLSRNGPELGIAFGWQWIILKHFTTEIYTGGGAYLQFYKEEYVAGPENEVIPEQTILTFRPYLGWTIGYLFRKE